MCLRQYPNRTLSLEKFIARMGDESDGSATHLSISFIRLFNFVESKGMLISNSWNGESILGGSMKHFWALWLLLSSGGDFSVTK